MILKRAFSTLIIAICLSALIAPVLIPSPYILAAEGDATGTASGSSGNNLPEDCGTGAVDTSKDNTAAPEVFGGAEGNTDRQNALNQHNSQTAELNQRQDALRSREEELTRAQAALTRAQSEGQGVEAAQSAVQQATRDRNSARDSVQEQQETINETTESTDYQEAQVQRQYEELIAATQSSRKEIDKEPDSSIKTEKIRANQAYLTYLRAKMNLEVCRAGLDDRDAADSLCNEYIKPTNDAGAAVRARVLCIAKLEDQKAQTATFEASRIFSATERSEERPASELSFSGFVNTVANWMITLVSSLAVTTLIIGGFMMVISGGDESRLETGKTIFTYSLIGLLITLTAFGIITFVQSIFY